MFACLSIRHSVDFILRVVLCYMLLVTPAVKDALALKELLGEIYCCLNPEVALLNCAPESLYKRRLLLSQRRPTYARCFIVFDIPTHRVIIRADAATNIKSDFS